MPEILIYTTNYCGYCRAAKSFFKDKGVEYKEIDLSNDYTGRQALAEQTGRSTVPQIFIGTTHIGGYDDLRALDRAGKLQLLLAGLSDFSRNGPT
jgi:glutaredoxin 3